MNMKKFLTSSVILSIICLSGCAGVKFREEDVNANLPDDWNYRTLVKNTSALRYHMAENVGLLVTPNKTSDVYDVISSPILPENFTAREETIKDGEVYYSKITKGAELKGSYLAFAAGLSANKAVEYRIIDISRADVPWTKFPDAEIRAAAAQNNEKKIKRLWIQSMILSRVLTQSYTEIKSDASGAGPTFKAEGKCFNSTGNDVHDYAIGVVLVDIDEWVQNNPGSAPSSENISTLRDLHDILDPQPKGAKKGTKKLPPVPEFISVESPISEIKGIIEN